MKMSIQTEEDQAEDSENIDEQQENDEDNDEVIKKKCYFCSASFF